MALKSSWLDCSSRLPGIHPGSFSVERSGAMDSEACESGRCPMSWQSTAMRTAWRIRSRQAAGRSICWKTESNSREAACMAPREWAWRVCVAPGKARSPKPSWRTLRRRWKKRLSTTAFSASLTWMVPWIGSRMRMAGLTP
ncbi:MAG: hypothetical protein QM765_31800 [Myxococcales bacterium]